MLIALANSVSVASISKAKSLSDSAQSFVEARFPAGPGARYEVARIDLNGDRLKDAIVYRSGWGCGSSGCNLYILERQAAGWKVRGKVTIAKPPIRVLPTHHRGWHDVGVWVSGGGVREPYEARLRFDGQAYPINPTLQPPSRSREGRTVIGRATP